jgi:hypothetical protein
VVPAITLEVALLRRVTLLLRRIIHLVLLAVVALLLGVALLRRVALLLRVSLLRVSLLRVALATSVIVVCGALTLGLRRVCVAGLRVV